jgi:hypothetical protein
MKLEYRVRDFLNPNHPALGTDLGTWWRVLKKHHFAIELPWVPKALFITATALVNAPVQWFERAWYDKRIQEAAVSKPIFILGHPRSGTTFLQYLVSQDPAFTFCSAYEGLVPHIFLTGGDMLRRLMQLAMPATRPQDNVRVSTTLPVEEEFAMANMGDVSWVHGLYFPMSLFQVFDEEVIFSGDPAIAIQWKERFEYFLKKLSYNHPGKQLILKSPANTGRLKEIYELFPDARFIHIHRNPYEVYQSNVRLYEKILPALAFHRVAEKVLQEYIFYFYEKIHKKYLADRALIPSNQLVEFSYADFVADPMASMRKAYDQLSLGDFEKARGFLEKEIEATRDYQKNTYVKLDPQIKDRIHGQWKFAFDAFGYKMG